MSQAVFQHQVRRCWRTGYQHKLPDKQLMMTRIIVEASCILEQPRKACLRTCPSTMGASFDMLKVSDHQSPEYSHFGASGQRSYCTHFHNTVACWRSSLQCCWRTTGAMHDHVHQDWIGDTSTTCSRQPLHPQDGDAKSHQQLQFPRIAHVEVPSAYVGICCASRKGSP